MRSFTIEEINSYPIMIEFNPYIESLCVCENISKKALNNLKELVSKKLMDITFIPKDSLEDPHSISLDIALDDHNEYWDMKYVYVSDELFKLLLTEFTK